MQEVCLYMLLIMVGMFLWGLQNAIEMSKTRAIGHLKSRHALISTDALCLSCCRALIKATLRISARISGSFLMTWPDRQPHVSHRFAFVIAQR